MQRQVHHDLMKFVTCCMWIFSRITHMLMMVLLAKHVHGWYSRLEHFENVNNLTLKSLLCDSTPIDKLMAYLQSIGVFSQV